MSGTNIASHIEECSAQRDTDARNPTSKLRPLSKSRWWGERDSENRARTLERPYQLAQVGAEPGA